MGRETRRVPADWVHPKQINFRTYKEEYKPLFDEDFRKVAAEWDKEREEYEDANPHEPPYDQWNGPRPYSENYMLVDVPREQRTHIMMYETTTKGTPISPAFETAEELAQWLADNRVPSFTDMTRDFHSWLDLIQNDLRRG